ncbi:MAG: PspC domain-containing protein [Odoribacteraceae bacterium]|jgi:phage shock protein PspC (stress-responsive transcriptional regulator)|nr:PspC domain-containing protein [Odoribacteraceae bacterium]
MEKVVTIHLDNKVFQMEEEAYNHLRRALENQWKRQELEPLVAGYLEQKLAGATRVITYPEVLDVLARLGISAAASPRGRERRLYRRPADKVLGGVCSGLGEYLDVDPVVIRVLFLLTLLMLSMGFWLYILLWIVVPNAPAEP